VFYDCQNLYQKSRFQRKRSCAHPATQKTPQSNVKPIWLHFWRNVKASLKRVDREDECMVISTWRSREDWNAWLNNEERATIQSEIDLLLGLETDYAVYEV